MSIIDEEVDKNKPEFNTSVDAANKVIDFSQQSNGAMKPGEYLAYTTNPFSKNTEISSPIATNNAAMATSLQANGFQLQPGSAPAPMEKPKFGKSGLDLNGDGIPDGAQVERTVHHQGPNGERIQDKIKWNKQAAGGNPVQPAVNPMQSVTDTDRPDFGVNPQAQARVTMGLDKPQEGALNPFSGAPTTAQEAIDLKMKQLERTASGKFGGSGAEKKVARTELAAMKQDELLRKTREFNQGIFDAKNANAVAVKQMDAQGALAVAREHGNAQRDAANITGEWGTKKVQTGNEGKLAVEEIRSKRATDVTGMLAANQLEKANIRALSDKTVAEIHAESEQAQAQLREQGREKEARILADSRFKIDAPTYMMLSQNMNEQQRSALMDRFLKGSGMPAALPGTPTTPASAAPAANVPPAASAIPPIAGNVETKTPQEAAMLPRGAKYRGTDGKLRVKS